MTTELTQRDRVTYGETIKISLETCGGNKYEFRDVFVSYSTDVGLGETLVEAMQRAAKVVSTDLEEQEREIRSGKKGVDLPTPENSGTVAEIQAELEIELKKLEEKGTIKKIVVENN